MFEPVRADLEAVEREFERQVQSQVHVIPEIGAYIQKSGGKRVRPAVLLMAARLCGYTGPRAVLNAAVVEFIHTATLVHDDIIDDADVRRGRKAVHSRWGNDVTVLAGDFLYIKSMAMALTQDTLDIVRLLCDVTLRMIEGEIYQLTKNGVVDLTEDEHFEIIHRKTAYLFGGCARDRRHARRGRAPRSARRCASTASTWASCSSWSTTCWTSRARPRRSASRSAATCARARSRCRSSTCCSTAAPRPTTLIRGIVQRRDVTPEQWARVKALLAEHRSIDYAYARAVEFGETAKRSLRLFPPTQEREALIALADFVLLRDR